MTEARQPAEWIDAGPLEQLVPGKGTLLRHGDQQVALFRVDGDRVLAVDNLCPHEGFPLVQGYVKDCVLTCAWHNFKFDLQSGACVQGDEDVATFPTRVQDGCVQVQVGPRTASIDVEATLTSLREGVLDASMGRVARDVARLLRGGFEPRRIAFEAARIDAEHAEWTTGHALPVAADVIRLLPRFEGVDATFPLMTALEMSADSNVRRPTRVTPPPEPAVTVDEATFTRLRQLVENEDTAAAEALFRGALVAGLDRETAQNWLLRLCSDHFLSFGHRLIYVIKAFDLADVVDWQEAQSLLPTLLFGIVNGTREDSLPPMRFMTEELAAMAPAFATWRGNRSSPATGVRSAALDGSKHEAFAAVRSALEAGASPLAIIDEIAIAAAERLLRYDTRHEFDPNVQENWLDITHALTTAHATRRALTRDDSPELIRLLFFAAHFVQRTRPLDGERAAPPATAPDRVVLEDRAIGDERTGPIFVAHALKTVIAAFELRDDLGDHPDRDLPVHAAARFLDGPLDERRMRRTAHEAVRFIRDGKPPHRLTP